jgi:NADPH:quinone reductase-like Zn-dependent oxidoreductase
MHEKSNEAVWLPAKHAALEIKAAAYPTAGDHEIVVKNSAVAINPLDWLTIAVGDILLPWTRYPFILGSDLAGEVVEVGRGVTRFKVGDRVLGHAVASDKSRNRPSDGAFQQFTLVLEHMASPIPDSLPYEDAAVVPLGLTTAACALFQKDQLALEHPSLDPTPTGKTVLIWGGSTSVGCNAIQLAVAAGYDVVTTASPKNFDFLRKLGATEAPWSRILFKASMASASQARSPLEPARPKPVMKWSTLARGTSSWHSLRRPSRLPEPP